MNPRVWLTLMLSLSLARLVLGQVAGEPDDRVTRRAVELLGQRVYRQAIEAMAGLLREAEDRISACYLRGYALYRLGEHTAALEELRLSEERQENAPPLRLYLLGACALETGDVSSALADFARYVSHSDDGRDADRRVVNTIRFSKAAGDDAERILENAAKEAPNGRQLLWRAILACESGKLEQADSLATEFLAAQPTDARGLFWRCNIRRRLGRDAEAVADYAELLRAHPLHARGFDEARARKRIADAGDLSYGRAQVEQLLRDRPLMGDAFDPANPLHVWTALGFQSVIDGRRIVWDSHFTRDDASAYHGFDARKNAWRLHVSRVHQMGDRKGRPQDAEELWAAVVFELENIANRPFFQALEDKARQGAIGRRDFVLGLTELEWQASQRSRAFHALIYFPWALENLRSPTYSAWYEDGLTFQDRSERLSVDAAYPWKIYGRQYDLLRRQGRTAP